MSVNRWCTRPAGSVHRRKGASGRGHPCCISGSGLEIPGRGKPFPLEASLLSTLPFLRLGAGRFASPLDDGAALPSENTFPVLATAADDVLLGATIMLPEHPQIAPESRGDLFDGTEIEEALLLHVLALSDDERASIERDDPAVRAMIERAAAATPAEILALHGRMTLGDPPSEEASR